MIVPPRNDRPSINTRSYSAKMYTASKPDNTLRIGMRLGLGSFALLRHAGVACMASVLTKARLSISRNGKNGSHAQAVYEDLSFTPAREFSR
jgi:hypothetical protein